MTVKMRLKIKKILQRYNINTLRPWQEHKYTKYVSQYNDGYMYKQHLSNIWSSIHKKVKQHWGWVEKSVAYIKKSVASLCEVQEKLRTRKS